MYFDSLSGPKRILLIEPPFYRLFGYKRWHYPMTLVLVGTYLQERGHEVLIYDADKPAPDCKEYGRHEAGENYYRYEQAINDPNHPVWREVRKIVCDFKPDIVGLTAITPEIDSANLVAKIVKDISPDIVTVLGGPHVTAMRSTHPDYDFGKDHDYIITAIPDLVDRKPNKKLLMHYSDYSPQNFFTIMTSAGCPFSCTFCCSSFNRKVMYRNIASIRSELEELCEEYGKEYSVYFIDESFLSNPKRFEEISRLMQEFGLKFQGGGRVMDLSPEIINTFMERGGVKVYIGIESGSQRILDLVKKKVTIAEIKRRTKWLNEAGLPWSAFFIAGFPFETLEDLNLTEELIKEIRPTFASLNHFTPYPGSRIYEEYYRDAKFRFLDTFQLNNKNYMQSDPDIRECIDHLFRFVEDYNLKNKVAMEK